MTVPRFEIAEWVTRYLIIKQRKKFIEHRKFLILQKNLQHSKRRVAEDSTFEAKN